MSQQRSTAVPLNILYQQPYLLVSSPEESRIRL